MKRFRKQISIAILWGVIAWLFISGRADFQWLAALALIGAGISFAAFAGPGSGRLKIPFILASISLSSIWLFLFQKIDVHWLAVINLMVMTFVVVMVFGTRMKRATAPLLLGALFFSLTWLAYQESINLYWQTVLMFMGINIIMSTSLNLVNGYMGEFNCGHAGPMAVGAYVSSLLSVWLFAQDPVLGAPLFPPE